MSVPNLRVLGLSLYDPLAASTRYRLLQYMPGLAERGIHLESHSLLGDDYVKLTYAGVPYPKHRVLADYLRRLKLLLAQGKFDVALVNAELFPLMPGFIESRLLRIPYVYDFDDAFHLKYQMARFSKVSFLLKNKFEPVVRRAAAISAGNQYLADFARPLNPDTVIIPTVVDTTRFVPLADVADAADLAEPGESPRPFTVGWIGSPSTAPYMAQLAEPLRQLAQEGPVRLLMVGGACPDIDGVEVVNLPWSEATEVDLINQFDVGVMPLFDDPWARGKCAFKLIQYMACGVPVVASPIGANVSVVTPDVGSLAHDASAWLNALRTLRDQPELRRAMGQSGRDRAVRHYSLQSQVQVLADVLRRASGARLA